MGFRDEFLGTGKTYAEWSIEKRIDTETCVETKNNSKDLQQTVKSTFERGIEHLAQSHTATTAALQAEVAYQVDKMLQDSKNMTAAIARGSTEVATSIQQMSDYLGSGLCEVRWAIERQTRLSEGIFQLLLQSLNNESRQYLEQGVKCYETGEPELAKERFGKALEANRTNYFVYQYLGFIAAASNNSDEAIRNFELASKFAEVDYHRALALSHLARCYFAKGELAVAVKFAVNAVNLHPETTKFWYDLAGYWAQLKDSQTIAILRKVIEKDWTYWAVVIVDKNFDPVRKDALNLLNELREQERGKARRVLDDVKLLIAAATEVGAHPDTSAYDDLEKRYTQSNIFVYQRLTHQARDLQERIVQATELHLEREVEIKKGQICSLDLSEQDQIEPLVESVVNLEMSSKLGEDWFPFRKNLRGMAMLAHNTCGFVRSCWSILFQLYIVSLFFIDPYGTLFLAVLSGAWINVYSRCRWGNCGYSVFTVVSHIC